MLFFHILKGKFNGVDFMSGKASFIVFAQSKDFDVTQNSEGDFCASNTRQAWTDWQSCNIGITQDAARWCYYAGRVASAMGISLAEMERDIDEAILDAAKQP
jgi:hypothetical protein